MPPAHLTLAHLSLMARYNSWMNGRIYQVAASLPVTALDQDRGAFFGSLLGTLNHLAVADTVWLGRFQRQNPPFPALAAVTGLPAITALDQRLFDDLAALWAYRQRLDGLIETWVAALDSTDLARPLAYHNTRGEAQRRRLGDILTHFFNHQTHHRGQATALLSQAGVDYGVTDLLALIPNLEEDAA